jgi:hypothetical protein
MAMGMNMEKEMMERKLLLEVIQPRPSMYVYKDGSTQRCLVCLSLSLRLSLSLTLSAHAHFSLSLSLSRILSHSPHSLSLFVSLGYIP